MWFSMPKSCGALANWAALRSSMVVLAFALPAHCVQETPRENGAGSKAIVAVRSDSAPRLDGSLRDADWLRASTISDFRQREPFETQPATERTEVKILYDKHSLYFGIHCFDSEPARVVSTELRRDADFSVDDYFTILISPNNDKRSGYTYTFNPLGTEFDSLVADEGRVNDTNWDGVWK